MKIKDLADKLGATKVEFLSPEEEVTYIATIQDARNGAVSFIANTSYEKFLPTTKASAVIVSEKLELPSIAEGVRFPALIRVKDPYASFAQTLKIFNPRKNLQESGIHPSSVISASARIHQTTVVMAHTLIGDDVTIGEHCVIHPNVTIYDGTVIGDRVVIGAGTVIGFDGFGYAPMADGTFSKVPQIGNVIIEDNVEIGANCTIDRATISHTIIRSGVKLDNLIHIAHNVEIGENTVIAAQTGISGSAKIGKHNMIAGQVGMIGHIETADNVVIIAQSGVSKSITKSGTYFGSPAKEHRMALKMEGALRTLPELIERVRSIEQKIEEDGNK
jgi:UDP-3-O-[3-hydroxymyristoyl] glucosamine N-acyltransferase